MCSHPQRALEADRVLGLFGHDDIQVTVFALLTAYRDGSHTLRCYLPENVSAIDDALRLVFDV